MSFSAFSSSHHLESWPQAPSFQMGQTLDVAHQHQQMDDLPAYHGDSHGVERELQFSDLGCRHAQAMG